MEKITSVNNQIVKETVKLQQKKYRDITKKFILEGFKAIHEACLAGIKIDYIFVKETALDKYTFFDGKKYSTNEPVLSKISTTDSAPEAVAVAGQRHFNIKEITNSNKIILLENIKDQGNLGTILRTSVAFGADAIILYGDCVDLYNPKCVRASVGNLWKIPVVHCKNIEELKTGFSNHAKIATLPRATHNLKDYTPKDKMLVMFGSEADGLSQNLTEFATESIKIEMNDAVESLNLAVSCAVIAYRLFV